MKNQSWAIVLVLVAGCSRPAANPVDNGAATMAMSTPIATAAPTPSPAPTGGAHGFDPASAPLAHPALGGFPFVGLLDGYAALNKNNAPSSFNQENQKDAAYDRYEFFDGAKLITVEGRLRTVEAIGRGASFFQAQKNYEKLIHDMGGVTVWEGGGSAMKDARIAFAEKRHRDRYNSLGDEKMGVYMVRAPDRQIWIEVYHRYDDKPDNYWLTVVEKKDLQVTAKLLPAEAMKQALDTAGHVALYVNFDTDRTAIRPDSQPLLAEVVKLMTANPALRLTVEGHTDNAGSPAHNQTLSDGRANAVVGSLMSQGVGAERLRAKGFGQSKPIAGNDSEDGRAKNRRVELVKQ